MSYEPHTWVAGETVTPSKLNNIEQGIANGGGGLIVNAEYNDISACVILDTTCGDILLSLKNGIPVFIKTEFEGDYFSEIEYRFVSSLVYEDNIYTIYTMGSNGVMSFYTESLNDYPTNANPNDGGTVVK